MTLEDIQKRALEIRALFVDFEKKQAKEWDTRAIMEGFVVDVGDLMKLIMAKDGLRKADDLDARIAHELVDCLWCVLVLAHKLDVDIEQAFINGMNSLEKLLKESMV